MTEQKLESAITITLLATALTTRQEYIIWTWSGIGGVLSGYVGSVIFPVKGIEFHRRWIVNFAIAIIAAPFLTWYLLPKFPTIPLPFLSMIVSGGCGGFGVTILPLILKKYGLGGKDRNDGKKDQ